jgi:hypothetical protein
MSEPQGSLITLMRFLEGHLSVSESDAARRRLDTPRWQSAWQRLQLAAVETTLTVSTWEEPTVPAETLAAFLDGSLSLDEATRIEQDCWESPELLREIVSTYRFMYVEASREEATASPPRGAATERLLALAPEVDQPPTQYAQSSTIPEIVIDGSPDNTHTSATTTKPGGDLPVVISKDNRTKRQRRSRTPAWMVYAATIAIGLGLGLGAVVMISLSRNKARNPLEEIVTPTEGQDPTAPQDDPQAPGEGTETPSEEPQQPGSNLPNTIDVPLPGRGFDIVTDDDPLPDDPLPRLGPSQRPPQTVANNPPPEAPYPSLAIDWEHIEGLLVTRDDATQTWQGALYASDLNNAGSTSYATLPDSWARAKTNHGQIVLASDTQVQLTGTRDTIELTLERGRVAISDVPANQTVLIQTARKSWIIKPLEENTALGFMTLGQQSQLIVRRGRVTIAGAEIIAGRQVSLSDDTLGKPSPIASSTKWFTRAEVSLKIPATTLSAWLSSPDVSVELARVWRIDDHPVRALAAHWSFAISNDQARAKALSHPNDRLRLAALHWLLTSNPQDPRVHAALRPLTRPPGNAQTVRNVHNWLASAHAEKMITRADAAQMIAGLRSDQLAIRQISKFFLENAFGDHVVMFDPKAGPGARAKAVREWNAALRKISDRVLRKTKRS